MMFCANPETSSEKSKAKEDKKPVVEMEQPESEKANQKQEISKPPETSDAPAKNLSPITTAPKNYVLYVPANSSISEPQPVVFIFDAHARGQIPVDLYRRLADEYGLMLAASNVSQNGQSIEKGLEIYRQMKNDLSASYSIDQSRIYTMGFSGGARVAVAAAIQHPEINSVIGCGAGFPEIMQLPESDFNYFAIVGYEDFNMNELINNDRMLRRAGFSNQLIIFDGGHDWPPADVMEEAFLGLRLLNMKSGTEAKNQKVITKAIRFYDQKINDYTTTKRYFDAAETAKRADALLSGLSTSNHFATSEKSFKKEPLYREDLMAMVNTLERESGYQNNYMQAFNDKPMEWWRDEIRKLKNPVENTFEARLNKRLLGFLGMVSYMLSGSAVAENHLAEAEKNIEIYRLLEPMNPEHAFLSAVVSMKNGHESLAIEYLRQARFLGFNNAARLTEEPAFAPIQNSPDFLELLN
jgi:hypothetical protein